MADRFSGLSVLTIAAHGDSREQDVWGDVASTLSNYETFWRDLTQLSQLRKLTQVLGLS
jgi:hypothetical protein